MKKEKRSVDLTSLPDQMSASLLKGIVYGRVVRNKNKNWGFLRCSCNLTKIWQLVENLLGWETYAENLSLLMKQ